MDYNESDNAHKDADILSFDEDVKNQYHPAYCAAIELELREDKAQLTYDKEYNLNTKPNKMDLLVIKNNGARLKNGIGAAFKKHNIIEFKSPGDRLNERVYNRTMGYVYLYMAYEAEDIPIEDITVTFLREGYPRKLMKWFGANGFEISMYEKGIYYVRKKDHVEMQVIVTGRLSSEHKWLTKISSKLEKEDFAEMNREIKTLSDDKDVLNAESVYELSMALNKDKEYMKEVIGMGIITDMHKENLEQKNKIEQLSEELQSKDKQLNELLKEVEELRKLVGNKIAML